MLSAQRTLAAPLFFSNIDPMTIMEPRNNDEVNQNHLEGARDYNYYTYDIDYIAVKKVYYKKQKPKLTNNIWDNINRNLGTILFPIQIANKDFLEDFLNNY